MIAQYLELLRTKSGFDKLEKREKIIVLLGIAFIVLFFALQFGLFPYLDAKKKVENSITKRKDDLIQLQLLQQEHRGLKADEGGIKTQLQKRPSNFSLFSFLDNQATETEIKEFISYMKPSTSDGAGGLQESLVEMKLQRITLEKLVQYLQKIESPENVVSIRRVSIQESGKEKGLLEVVLQIVTFMDKG